MAIDSKGRIVAAGGACADNCNSGDFAVARYKQGGHLDPSFGTDGQVRTDFAGNSDGAASVAIDSQGRIIAAGQSCASACEFALARYKPNGALDPSFGAGGKVTTAFATGQVKSVALDSNGRVIVAGSACNTGGAGGCGFALARYKPNGKLDPTFGAGGWVITNFGGGANSIVIDSAGRIVAAGTAFSPPSASESWFALARYQPNGDLDQGFGHGGKLTTSFGDVPEAHAYSVALDSRDRIIAAGDTAGKPSGGSRFALARYTRSGRLDRTFGHLGKVTTRAFGPALRNGLVFDSAASVAIDSHNRIVAGGNDSAGLAFELARYVG